MDTLIQTINHRSVSLSRTAWRGCGALERVAESQWNPLSALQMLGSRAVLGRSRAASEGSVRQNTMRHKSEHREPHAELHAESGSWRTLNGSINWIMPGWKIFGCLIKLIKLI